MEIKLSPQQELAATNRGGNLLVSAAAGSGKTKVLVDRLMFYILDPERPANIDDFLIITYTKAAASELRGKIIKKLNEMIADAPQNRHLRQQLQRVYLAKISTVHSFCADLLREQAFRLDIPGDFRIAETEEADHLRLLVLSDVFEDAYGADEIDQDFQAFADSQQVGKWDDNLAKIVLDLYESAMCHKEPELWLNKCLEDLYVDHLTDAGQTVWGEYLIAELHNYIAMQISAISKCLDRAYALSATAKAVTVLENELQWLKGLSQCKTWDALYSSREFTFERFDFGKKFPDKDLQEEMKAVRNLCKAEMQKRMEQFSQNSEQTIMQLTAVLPAARGLISLVLTFKSAYDQRKRQLRIFDYTDLEHKTLDLLMGKNRRTPTKLADELSGRFREIMVDEFQDSNQVQDAIFQSLTGQNGNCFMVGDVKQSIYQFRLADPEIFLEKFHTYLPAGDAKPGEGRKVLLTKNYRSSPAVIEAVNHICSKCMSEAVGGIDYNDSERLNPREDLSAIDEPEVSLYTIAVQSDTYAEEAAFVAEQILTLTDGTHMIRDGDVQRPITYDDIAIILRSPGSIGGEFSAALHNKGIPVYISKGSNLLLTEEVMTLRAFLQCICNPQLDIPLIAVLSSRVFQFSADDLAVIREQSRSGSFYSAVCKSRLQKAKVFIEVLDNLREYARLYSLSELVMEIFRTTDFDSIFAADKSGKERVQNLQTFCKLLSSYESTARRTLDQFLEYLEILEAKGISGNEGEKPSGAVEILSVHKSKGLEYPVVFLSGLSRSFNLRDTTEQLLRHKHLGLGFSYFDSQKRIRFPTAAKKAIAKQINADTVSQEMLVLYVALTRAKDRLIMTYAAKNLQKDVSEIVNRMQVSDPLLMTASAKCPGDWILYAALQRSEAGALFQLGEYPECRQVTEIPWHIETVTDVNQNTCVAAFEGSKETLDEEIIDKIAHSLSYCYPYTAATACPSKLTATELKGRFLDDEVAQNAKLPETAQLSWRSPADIKHSGVAYGNAMHTLMQYICYAKCGSVDGVKAEIERLTSEDFLSSEQAERIDPQTVADFFQTDVGQQVMEATDILREFKFSVLQDASRYHKGVVDDEVLLQGVVDLAVIAPDGITVIDFKTDYVTQDTLSKTAEKYTVQVKTYAEALQSIYDMPVKKVMLYFFRLNTFVEVK